MLAYKEKKKIKKNCYFFYGLCFMAYKNKNKYSLLLFFIFNIIFCNI